MPTRINNMMRHSQPNRLSDADNYHDCVIPKPRAFTSGARDLARTISALNHESTLETQ